MKKNIGQTDKLIRVVIAAIVALLYYNDTISGTLAYILMGLAIYVLITCLLNYSPLYKLLQINTNGSGE